MNLPGMNINKFSTEPNAMNENPPKCFLGCCNVRSWTLFVSLLNVVSLLVQIINVFRINEKLLVAIYYAIIYVGMIVLNIELGRGVIRRNIVPVLNWLRFYTLKIIITNALLTFGLVLVAGEGDPFSFTGPQMKENPSVIMLGVLSFDVVFVIVHYPVYQYYKFQKACSQQTIPHKKSQTI